jgi:endonuclease/exonuclease/phosphatase family metal-dependent hydrolase
MLDKSHNLPKSIAAALRRRAPQFVRMSQPSAGVNIASYNIHKCVGTDGRFDPVRTAKVIEELDVDLIALQEADERLGERNGLLDLNAIADVTGLKPLHQSEHRNSHGWHGNLVLGRASDVEDVSTLKLPGLEPRGALIIDLAIKGAPLRIIAAHFGLLRRSRSMQARVLLNAAATVQRPTVLLGDFNEWRINTRSSLLPLLPQFGPLEAALPSFPSRFPCLPWIAYLLARET